MMKSQFLFFFELFGSPALSGLDLDLKKHRMRRVQMTLMRRSVAVRIRRRNPTTS
jgi:hypothetical protein